VVRLLRAFSNFIGNDECVWCVEGCFFFFLKCVIGEQGVALVLFFNKKLITIALETLLCN